MRDPLYQVFPYPAGVREHLNREEATLKISIFRTLENCSLSKHLHFASESENSAYNMGMMNNTPELCGQTSNQVESEVSSPRLLSTDSGRN